MVEIGETADIVLRRAGWGDAFFMSSLIGNSTVRRFLGKAVPLRRHPTVIAGYLRTSGRSLTCVALHKASRRPLGLVFLTPHKDGKDHELSYMFHPSIWGQGLAAAAVGAMRDHGLHHLGMPRLIAETQVANQPSCRLLQKIGMSEISRTRRFGALQAIYATSPAMDLQT